MKGYVRLACTFVLASMSLMLVLPALSQPYNQVAFYQSTYLDYSTYGDLVPNTWLPWNYSSSSYEVYNWWDETHEIFDGLYMNLTTHLVYDEFYPCACNETGISPGGIPYYLWKYPNVRLPDDASWYTYGNPSVAPMLEPGFATGRLYTPKAVTEETASLQVLTGFRVEQEFEYVHISVDWWDTYEASPKLTKAVLLPRGQDENTNRLMTTESPDNQGYISWSVYDPPVDGVFLVYLVFSVTNNLYPTPIKYLPSISVFAYRYYYEYPGYTDRVTFTAQDGGIITIASKKSYDWYISSSLGRYVSLLQVSETV